MFITRTLQPVDYPVTLQEAREYLQITHNEYDSLIQNLIDESTDACERYIGQSLITQEWTLTLDDFPCENHVHLLRGPLVEATAINYIDDEGIMYEFDVSQGYTNKNPTDPIYQLNKNIHWPDVKLRESESFSIKYTAGYGERDDVPHVVKQGILLEVVNKFENRDMDAVLSPEAMRLWKSVRRVTL